MIHISTYVVSNIKTIRQAAFFNLGYFDCGYKLPNFGNRLGLIF